MKKWLMLAIALTLAILPADFASARGGGRGGGGGGRGGRGGARGAGRGGMRGGNSRSGKDKKNRQLLKDRALAENLDAVKRDTRLDSV